MLGWHRWLLACAWLGHHGRGKGQLAWLEHEKLWRPASCSSSSYGQSGRTVGWAGKVWKSELHLRLPSALYARKVPAASEAEATGSGLLCSDVWIRDRLSEANSAG